MKPIRICDYRNCSNEVTGRKDKFFCSRKCKTHERTYRKREQKQKEEIKRLIQLAASNQNLELYKLIYS